VSLFDFCRRIDRHTVNRRSIEALIRAGAFDQIEPNRAALIASLGTALEAAEQVARSANQVSLFGDDGADVVESELAQCAPWDLHARLSEEKLALAKSDCIVMHPGPMNRGVEIDSAVADGKQSVILNQVTFGIAVRMAVMSIVAGASA